MTEKDQEDRKMNEFLETLWTKETKARMEKFRRSIPVTNRPGEKKLCFWMVSKPDWKNGEPHRVRKALKDARALVEQGYTVTYDEDQLMPNVGYVAPGGQRALIYGARGKPPWESDL